MGMILSNANWIAVIITLVAGMGLGFFWYNPKFPTGKMWAEGVGVSGESDNMPMMGMALNTLGILMLALLSGSMGFSMAIFVIVTFGVFLSAGYIFAGKSLNVGIVHTGYWLAIWVVGYIMHSIF